MREPDPADVMVRTCEHCGRRLARRRGNLTQPFALENAVDAILARHVRLHHSSSQGRR